MAKKNHYYVIVFTGDGAMYVTDTEYSNAFWNKLEAPKEMSRDFATDVARGLTCNGFLAQVVMSTYELTHQPYNYESGSFSWTWTEGE